MTGLAFMGTGVVIEDLKPNETILKVSLIDEIEHDGILGNDNITTTVVTDNSSTRKVMVGTEVDYVTATWEGLDNQINAPTITKGEQVSVFRYKNQDLYYWSKSRGFETDLRGREVIIDGVSTLDRSKEENIGKSVTVDDMYYIIKDSLGGKIKIVTNMKNEELASYVLLLDGKNGRFSITDDRGNFIDIDTVKDEATISTNKAANITSPKVNIKCDELNIDTKKTNFNSTTTILKGSKFTADVNKSDFTGSVSVAGSCTIGGTTTLKASLRGLGGAFKSAVKFAASGKTW